MTIAVKFAGVAALVGGLAWVGMQSGRVTGQAPAVWWANAALVSVLLLDAESTAPPDPRTPDPRFPAGASTPIRSLKVRTRNWPLLLAAGFLGNFLMHVVLGGKLPLNLTLSACDTGEAAIAAYGVAFSCRQSFDLTRQEQLIRFVLIAVGLAPLCSATAAGAILHPQLDRATLAFVLLWFVPSALGMSVVPPLVLGLARRETWELFRLRRLPKTLIYMAALVAGTAVIFSRSQFPLLFLLLPPLLLLVLRLGISGGALGCILIAVAGTDFTVHSHGAALLHIDYTLQHRILLLQLFLATAVLSVSVVGIVLAELRRASREVHESELRYRSLAASMEMLARIDPLTRVANRRRFDEALQQEWHRAVRTRTPLSLVLFDADFFKDYNDHYGHVAGDECLRKIADKMSEMARRPADLVARFGGEEFALLLPDTSAEGAFVWAERLRKGIEDLAFPHPSSPSGIVTVSGGCAATIPAARSLPIDLLHAADAALYEAKRNGRNRIEAVRQARAAMRGD